MYCGVIEYSYDFSPAASLVHPQHLQIFFIFPTMYLLSCPNCQAELPVTPAQAGDSMPCPKCQGRVAIPKLGELRKLPQSQDPTGQISQRSQPAGGAVLSLMLGLIAVASLLGAGYNTVRWAMIKTTTTTQSHLQELEESYARVEPSAMILEFEDMEGLSLDLTMPYKYHKVVMEKARWGRNALIAGGVALICGLGAFAAASLGRRPKNVKDT